MTGISPGLTRGALVLGLLAGLGTIAYHAVRRPAPPEAATAAVVPDPQAPADAAGASGVATAAQTPSAPEAPAAEPPSFDVVRVAPDGAAVVAGRAEPGAQVTISGDAGPLAEATANAAGEFVAVFDAPPSGTPQALRLEAETADGVTTASPDVVVLVPPTPAADPAQASASAGAASPASPATGAQAAVAPGAIAQAAPAQEAAAAEAEPAPEVAATVVLRGGGAEASPTAPDAGFSLASISYAETGLVTLAGLGVAGARIRAYVDNRFALDGAVGADGRWALELGDVEAGIYRLRIDALREDGTVASRIETPFQRDFPAPPPSDGSGRPATITVQPGNNLWTLARTHYGAGVLYTQIHTANAELIRDPELIYPGQIFVLPEAAAAE